MNADIQRKYDIILTHMPHTEVSTGVLHALRNGGHNRLVVDIDDFAWGYPKGSGTEDYWTPENLKRLEMNLRVADLVTTPSDVLAEYVSQFNENVLVQPNTIPEWVTTTAPSTVSKFRIGYQGASQHKLDFTDEIMRHLSAFLFNHGRTELHLYGFSEKSVYVPGEIRNRIIVKPWQSDINEYYKSLRFEAGIGPLAANEFNRYKSDIRRREYMAIGAVPVLQNYGPYESDFGGFMTGYMMYERLHDAYMTWRSPRRWADEYQTRRRHARDFFTTERNIGGLADGYARLAAGRTDY